MFYFCCCNNCVDYVLFHWLNKTPLIHIHVSKLYYDSKIGNDFSRLKINGVPENIYNTVTVVHASGYGWQLVW